MIVGTPDSGRGRNGRRYRAVVAATVHLQLLRARPGRRHLCTAAGGALRVPTIIEMWLPLSWSLNMVNRSMGHDDLYPFVLPAPVLEKMGFIHSVIDEVTRARKAARRRRLWLT